MASFNVQHKAVLPTIAVACLGAIGYAGFATGAAVLPVGGAGLFGLGLVAGALWRGRGAGGSDELGRVLDGLVAEDGSVSFAAAHGEARDAAARKLLDALRRIERSIDEVRVSAQSIGSASGEIASGNQDLSNRTEQTASELQRSASSIAQLASTVNQTAESSRTANQLASSATDVAQRGGEVVSQVITTMDEINAASKKISDIIGVIDGIAFQTNILALNAAVEAARAGEQGRGFAVVAGEVRSLAQRSAAAAKEIKTLIGTSVDRVETGAKLVQDAGATMAEIVASVRRVSDIIGEINAATQEQSAGIREVNQTIGQLDQMTQQNAALVEESAAAAESLKEQAGRLGHVVATFRSHDGTPAAARAEAAPVAQLAIDKARRPAAAAPKAAAPATRPAAAPAAGGEGDWTSF